MGGHETRNAADMELLERVEKLYVAVVADCLDRVASAATCLHRTCVRSIRARGSPAMP
jgi:hypothetical protein